MNDLYRNLGIATVWQRESGDQQGADFRRRLRAIESGAAELNLDPAAVHVAAEMAAFDPMLDNEQRFALIVLITVSLAALQEGSTRLPVSDADGRRLMRRMLAPLSTEEPGGADAVADS